MEKVTYEKEITAVLVIDPYNDFISEGGKVWDRLRGVAEANQCVSHMLQVLNAAREAGIRVFYASGPQFVLGPRACDRTGRDASPGDGPLDKRLLSEQAIAG